jgi:hypothetical protein
MRTMPVVPIVVAAVSAAVVTQANTLSRDRDPVVISGGDLPALQGIPVDEVVGFRFQGGWQQVPVQIDERKRVDYGVVYNQGPVGVGSLAYTDGLTYTGPDDDPTLDANDELVFMAMDAGDRAGAGAGRPAGVFGEPALEVEIVDPLDGGVGYVYLFRSDGSLAPGAGRSYVSYTFNLLAGDYIPNYGLMAGPNPEDSEAFSPYYRTHFSDRWIRDEVNVFAGTASGADILDRHKNMFGPGNCARTENTFSNGEGAFFANKSGPVRAIRSYMGANSGPFTQRDHLFYQRRQDIVTHLRVHAISGVIDVYDYSPQAEGMIYFDDLNLLGATVDGLADAIVLGSITWEMVTGQQGTLVMGLSFETDIPAFAYTSYYSDDITPGPWVNQPIPNTDPSLGLYNILATRRVIYYEPPYQTTGTAELLSEQARTPLQVTVSGFTESPGDLDGDGDVDLNDFATFATCFSGSAVTTPPPSCSGSDFAGSDMDNDGDVDLNDFATFSSNFTG